MSLVGVIEAGGTKFAAPPARPDGTLLDRMHMDTQADAKSFAKLANRFAVAARHGPIAALGVARFGPFDLDSASPAHGIFTTTLKPEWSGVNWHEALKLFGVPVAIDIHVNGAAMGERMAGAGRGRCTIAYTTISAGIGTSARSFSASRAPRGSRWAQARTGSSPPRLRWGCPPSSPPCRRWQSSCFTPA
ncbi:ROK family protein [Erythrobacter arachoides]|uniref:ROK family protein n=1 Tax=Aurantiacibacter arachoides TaxID=1850444 RepID=A0A845A577_9SPHN|nr:ROK family protein [Aurantiacibacter arachoides]MXO94087.1 ROK family protein [Aurantiacibacter arachoides]GGD66150.1 hypothetical protein GCM10011411_28220 [Aurantiacibacter arachoides]